MTSTNSLYIPTQCLTPQLIDTLIPRLPNSLKSAAGVTGSTLLTKTLWVFLGRSTLTQWVPGAGLEIGHTDARDGPASANELSNTGLEDGGRDNDGEVNVLAPMDLDRRHQAWQSCRRRGR